jgi:anaerobic magnesium-protoporphyrin IX monomethyl ester cyclase
VLNLLLTHGYFLEEDAKEQQIMKPYAPLGILSLSSYLRAKGFGVEIYDSTFGSKEQLFSILEADPPDALGIYGNLLTRRNVLEIAARAKQAGCLVILGGPEPANYAEEYLSRGADVIVAGEGEYALEEVLVAGRDRSRWASIPGVVFAGSDGSIIRTGPAKLVPDLDAQPWPDRERIDMERYLGIWRKHHGAGSISVISARGCPYHCNWCSHSVYGKSHRRRSPESIVSEVEWIVQRYSPDMLWFADDVFTIHHGWVRRYAELTESKGIRIPFECITRADRINEEMVRLLARIGCYRVWIGSESGSQRVLDAMQRGVKVEQVQSAVALCRDYGIQTGMFLMWGYEGEEISDIEATIDHVKVCRPDTFFTTVAYPIAGTPYFERVQSKLVKLQPWNQSTDRDVAIRGRHSRNFYRHADELLKLSMANDSDVSSIEGARTRLHGTAMECEA